jgi:signal transduction histidine kinase
MLATSKLGPNSLGALARFGLLALVPVVALGAVLAHELNADVQQRYLEATRSSAELIAQVGIQPLLNAQEVARGLTPAEVAQVDVRLQGAAVNQEVQRIKVWNPAGTIVYSDNRALIGKTVPIDDDLAAALAGHSSASITDGRGTENAGDDLTGPLVQAYVPMIFRGTSTISGVFEMYLPYSPVQAAIDHESQQLYVVLAAGLTLFYASMFPVVVLADRWRRRLQREAETAAMANLATLERLNRLKSEFLTRISHQFRTALVGIQGFSEVIRDSKDLDVEMVKTYASDIYNDADRLDRAFNEMLELDRLEAGGTILTIDRVDLNQLIKTVVESTRAQSPDHVLMTNLDRSLVDVSCDRDKFSRVLAILLSNSIKFSPAGSTVDVTSRMGSDYVEITVKDHGPGMPAGFDAGLFVGSKESPADEGNPLNGGHGTGLGLPMARQIVEMHGGRIWFDSAIDQGSEFHVTLPLEAQPLRDVQATTSGHPSKAPPVTAGTRG